MALIPRVLLGLGRQGQEALQAHRVYSALAHHIQEKDGKVLHPDLLNASVSRRGVRHRAGCRVGDDQPFTSTLLRRDRRC
jgi:hypothetical protein